MTLRVVAWQLGNGARREVAPATPDGAPLLVSATPGEAALVASAVYGLLPGGVHGPAPTGSVTVQDSEQVALGQPGRPAAPTAPVNRLVVALDEPALRLAAQPASDDARRLAALTAPADPAVAARLDAALARIEQWRVELADPASIERRLAALDRRLAALARRAQTDQGSNGRSLRLPLSGSAQPPLDRRAAVEAAQDAQRHADAQTQLASERAAIDDDLRHGREAVAGADARIAELSEQLARLDELPADGDVAQARSGLAELTGALAGFGEARREAEASGNTAAVVAHALAGVRSTGTGSWAAWVQPIALIGASIAVIVAVLILLGGGHDTAGVVCGVVALATAALALALPTRALRRSPEEVKLALRLAKAEEDHVRLRAAAAEAGRRSAELALLLGLPADPSEADLDRRRHQLEEWTKARRAADDLRRARDVARNTAAAAHAHVAELLAARELLDGRADALDQAWQVWRERHRLPAWLTPAEASARFRAEAAVAVEPATEPANLAQERQGLLDELAHARWEQDRLDLAALLLGNARRQLLEPIERLDALVGQLSGGRLGSPRVVDGALVLHTGASTTEPQRPDDGAVVMAALRLVDAELAAGSRWPIIVTGVTDEQAHTLLDPPGLADVLNGLAARTQVLVARAPAASPPVAPLVSPPASPALATGGEPPVGAGIRVAVTPAE